MSPDIVTQLEALAAARERGEIDTLGYERRKREILGLPPLGPPTLSSLPSPFAPAPSEPEPVAEDPAREAEIERLVGDLARIAPEPAPPPPADRLRGLLDRGLISQTEYDAAAGQALPPASSETEPAPPAPPFNPPPDSPPPSPAPGLTWESTGAPPPFGTASAAGGLRPPPPPPTAFG